MRPRFTALLLVVLGALAFWCVPASAHAPAYGEYDQPPLAPTVDSQSVEVPKAAWHAATSPLTLPWTALAAALVLVVGVARRPRRAFALAIVLILALFAFEDGVHSVHHLNDPTGRAACAVALAASTHAAGPPAHGWTAEPLIVLVPERLIFEQQPSLNACPLAAHQGRAPPLAV
jgi:hypothetical protein